MLATVIFKIGGGDHVKCTLILFGGRTFRGFEASVSKNIAEAGVTLTVPLGQYNHMANCLVRLRQRWKIVESEHASKTHTIAAMMRNAFVSVGSESFVAAQLLLVMGFLKLLDIAIYSTTSSLPIQQSFDGMAISCHWNWIVSILPGFHASALPSVAAYLG
jgi:hypothetical protein